MSEGQVSHASRLAKSAQRGFYAGGRGELACTRRCWTLRPASMGWAAAATGVLSSKP